jgi:hypothetical protein
MFSIRQLIIIANFLVAFALTGCGGEEKTPIITSFSPASGPVGTTVTIIGDNFSLIPSNNVVTFNGSSAIVTSSTGTEIITTVPAGASTGLIAIIHNSQPVFSATNFVVTLVAVSKCYIKLHTINNDLTDLAKSLFYLKLET